MRAFLVDGTYELFRHFFGAPSHANSSGVEVAATRGVVSSMISLMEEGAAYVGVATDHVIESFRNDLWPRYWSVVAPSGACEAGNLGTCNTTLGRAVVKETRS